MGKIRFAVWNLDGTAMNGRALTDPKCDDDPSRSKYLDCIRYRIRLLLNREPDCDFIFFQEIPDPDWLKIPDLHGEWISCRKPENNSSNLTGQTGDTMNKSNPDNASGILLSQNNTGKGIVVKKVQTDYESPIGTVYSVCNRQGILFYFIGFWNVPEKKNRPSRTDVRIQKKYLSPFLDLLDRVTPLYTPCVIAGDTNVYIQFGENGLPETKLLTQEYIQRYLEPKGLNLINGPNNELDHFTLRFKRNRELFRCDLLIASSSLQVQALSLGDIGIYMDRRPGEKYHGSDHRPIFFEVSVPD